MSKIVNIFFDIFLSSFYPSIRGELNSMKKVVLYPRVSTKGQVEDGYSLDFQVEKMLAYCKAMDYAVVGIYSDNGYSGANLERPGIQRIIQEAPTGKFDAVIVYKLDRLSRSQKHTMYMLEDVFIPNDIAFVSMSESFDTSTQFGIAMVGILSVFSQLERANIAERTFDGRKGRAKKGSWHGGGYDPIGYDYIDGELVINRVEAEQVRMVYEYYAAGMTITEISRRMEQFTTKHGDWHHPETIANVLDNPLYAGIIHFEDVRTPDSHTAIISKELYNNVADMRSGVHKHIKKDSKYLLSGLVYCKNCGARYFVKKNPNGNLFYCCHSRAKVNKLMVKDPLCKNKNWKMEELEQAVYEEIKRLADNPHLLYELKKTPSDKEESEGHNPKVHEEVDNINRQIGTLMDLYQANDNTIQIEDVAQRIDELYQKKVELLNIIKPTKDKERYTKSFNVENARLIISDLPAAMREGNINMVRYSLLRLLDMIEVEGKKVCFHWSFVK